MIRRYWKILALALSLMLVSLPLACDRGGAGCEQDDPIPVPTDQTIRKEALYDKVDVLVDEWGIPHIYARNDLDAIFVQGYMAARDRFAFMELFRRLGQGRVGELVGSIPFVGTIIAAPIVDELDVFFRAIFTGRDGEPIIDSIEKNLDPGTRLILRSYAQGVSAFLEDMTLGINGATPPPSLDGLIAVDPALLEPWAVRDILGMLLVNFWVSTNSMEEELALGDALATLGADRFADFYRAGPDDPTTVLPTGGEKSRAAGGPDRDMLSARSAELAESIGAIRAAKQAVRRATAGLVNQGQHSNNWAVAAENTARGYALVAGDPHLDLFNPSLFWLVHVDAKTFGVGDLSFAGLSAAGAPGAQIAHNDYVGWAGTAANYDTLDVYIESVSPSDTVTFEGGQVDLIVNEELFYTSLDHAEPPIVREIKVVPHHGPIVPGSCEAGRCVSMKWTGAQPGEDIKAFIDILFATDLTEGLDAYSQYRRGPYNWVLGDTNGDVGYIAAAEVPIRENAREHPPYLPLPGTGGAEWIGTVPDADIARLENPAGGVVVTANNDIYGTVADNDALNDEYYFYFNVDIGYRAGRITALLTDPAHGYDTDALTLADMRAIQFDNLSVAGVRLVPFLFEAADERPDLVTPSVRVALDYLETWDFTTPAATPDRFRGRIPSAATLDQSIACTIFHVWFGHLALRVFGDEFHAAGMKLPAEESVSGPQFETRALAALLDDPDQSAHGAQAWWDTLYTPLFEDRDEALIGSLQDALGELTEELGPDPRDWAWGKLHTIEFLLTFEGFSIPTLLWPAVGPGASDGGNFTVNVANTYDLTGDLAVDHAPNARLAMEIGGEFETWGVLPGGQSERFDSPHYADQFALYLSGGGVPVLYDLDDIVEVTETRIEFIP